MAYRGDLIGCTVNFDIPDKVSVLFTLNGKQITQEKIYIDNPYQKPLYPYIGMSHKGIRVLAKVSMFLVLIVCFFYLFVCISVFCSFEEVCRCCCCFLCHCYHSTAIQRYLKNIAYLDIQPQFVQKA